MVRSFWTYLTARRAFIQHWAMEIAIVVLGILIAFALQGWGEDIAARRRSDLAMARIRAEIFDNAMIFTERLAVDGCARDRLRYLSDGLISGGPTWRADTMSSLGSQAPVMRRVYRVPNRTTVTDSYRAAVATEDLAGTDAAQRTHLDNLFSVSNTLNETNRAEQDQSAELKPLSVITLTDSGDRADMLGRLARLDDANRLTVLMGKYFLDTLRKADLRPDDAELRRIRENTDWSMLARNARAAYGSCWDVRAIDRFDARLR